MGNNRLIKMVQADAIPNRGGVFIDAYNQSTNEEIAGTITTRVDAANMIYVTEVCSTKARKYTHTKVSIGTPRKSSSVENWGGGLRDE